MSDIQDQDNQFEDFEESPGGSATPPPSGGGRNRAFYIAIGLIGTIFVIALVILLWTLFNKGPQQAAQTKAEADSIIATNTSVAATATADQLRIVHLQQTLEAATPTPLPSATFTLPAAATATSVLAIPTATGTPTATVSADNATKTAVAKTNVALGTKPVNPNGYPGPTTSTPGPQTPGAPTAGAGTPQATATGLPTTGFADEVGLPGLLGMAALLLVVIFLARRTRLSH
jgi:hypothetical protein